MVPQRYGLTELLYTAIISTPAIFTKIGLFKWRIEGLENLPPRKAGGMVIVMNHMNWLDILAAGTLFPFSYRLSWLGKMEIFETTFTNWLFRNLDVIPIRRGKGDIVALETSEDALRNGAVMMIFPEGHRSETASLQEAHGGAIRLAMRSCVPIVPTAITGSEFGLRGSFTRKELLIRIGTPYMIEPTPNNKIPPSLMNRLTIDMMLRIAALLPEKYHGYYKGFNQTVPLEGSPSALQPVPLSLSMRHHL